MRPRTTVGGAKLRIGSYPEQAFAVEEEHRQRRDDAGHQGDHRQGQPELSRQIDGREYIRPVAQQDEQQKRGDRRDQELGDNGGLFAFVATAQKPQPHQIDDSHTKQQTQNLCQQRHVFLHEGATNGKPNARVA